MANRRVGGQLFLKVDGVQLRAKGEFTYNLGVPKREPVTGVDEVHGFSELPQPPSLSGSITDGDDISVEDILNLRDSVVVIQLANNKLVKFDGAFYSADGNITSNEGEIEFQINAIRAEEIAAIS